MHGRLLSEIASRLPNAPIQIEEVGEDDGIVLTCGSARTSRSRRCRCEYPAIPEVSGESGLVPAEEFATAIAQVAFAASRDDVTPVLTGVQLEVSGTQLSLVATDRYRVALRESRGISATTAVPAPATNPTTALVSAHPDRGRQDLRPLGRHPGRVLGLGRSRDHRVHLGQQDRHLATDQGNFPPVRRLFPEQTEHYAVVSTSDLAEAVRRVSLVLDRSAPLRFTFTEDGVSMDASGTEQARATESVDATLAGEEVTLGLNPRVPAQSARRGQERVRTSRSPRATTRTSSAPC